MDLGSLSLDHGEHEGTQSNDLLCETPCPPWFGLFRVAETTSTPVKSILCTRISDPTWSSHGTSLRHLRQEAAIWKYHQPRPQRVSQALERQPAARTRQSKGRHQAHSRLHVLPTQRQSGQGLGFPPPRSPSTPRKPR